MALSNIRNEPRREITEQVVGTAMLVAYIASVYGIVCGLGAKEPADWIFGTILVAVLLPVAVALLFLLTIAIHGVGDLACDGLAKFGMDPRPTQRYRR